MSPPERCQRLIDNRREIRLGRFRHPDGVHDFVAKVFEHPNWIPRGPEMSQWNRSRSPERQNSCSSSRVGRGGLHIFADPWRRTEAGVKIAAFMRKSSDHVHFVVAATAGHPYTNALRISCVVRKVCIKYLPREYVRFRHSDAFDEVTREWIRVPPSR